VSCGVDNTVRIWDAFAGKEITQLQSHTKPVNSVAYSMDGLQLVSASDDCTLKVWDAILGKEVIGGSSKAGTLRYLDTK
jgi:WD40 repeat protein